MSYKEKFANIWQYNTSSRFRVEITGNTFSLETKIDKSSLKVGDKFEILRRNEQTVEGTLEVGTINLDNSIGAITTFTPNSNIQYDIRRIIEKANTVSYTHLTLPTKNEV